MTTDAELRARAEAHQAAWDDVHYPGGAYMQSPVAEVLALLDRLQAAEEGADDAERDLQSVEEFWRVFQSKGETIDIETVHGCTCPLREPNWQIDPNCQYHANAAKYPYNHANPWNCPTYWDGCNCKAEVKELKGRLQAAERERDGLLRSCRNGVPDCESPGGSIQARWCQLCRAEWKEQHLLREQLAAAEAALAQCVMADQYGGGVCETSRKALTTLRGAREGQ